MNEDFENEELEEESISDPVSEEKKKKLKKIGILAAGFLLIVFIGINAMSKRGNVEKEPEEKVNLSEQTIDLTDLQDIEDDNLNTDLAPLEENNSYSSINQQNYENNNLPDYYQTNTYPEPPAFESDTPNYYSNDSISDSTDSKEENSMKGSSENSEKAKKSKIGFRDSVTNTETIQTQSVDNNSVLVAPKMSDQEKKMNFLNSKDSKTFLLQKQLQQNISPYEVKAGSLIPATLVTKINSDLPSDVVAVVREDIYDSVTGKFLLIPSGSKLYGNYDSQISYGQNRLLMVWQRVQLPNGFTIELERMPGVDLAGQAGITGKVNNHYWKLLRSVVLSSIFNFASNGVSVVFDKGGNNSSGVSVGAQIGGTVADNTSNQIQTAGDKIIERDLNQQPTIVIKSGTKFNILVNKDMVLYPYSKIAKR